MIKKGFRLFLSFMIVAVVFATIAMPMYLFQAHFFMILSWICFILLISVATAIVYYALF